MLAYNLHHRNKLYFFISDYFNIYFPIALLILTLATYFSLGARLLTILGFQQFLTQDSEVTLDLVDEGMNEFMHFSGSKSEY